MKLYLLVNVQDTDDTFGTNVTPFTDKEAAQAAMREELEEAVKSWDFDKSIPETDEHYCVCTADNAVIHDGDDEENWRIEEHEISVDVAVEVVGGMVSNVYANADLRVEVYDLDAPDHTDEGEQYTADVKAKELAALIKSPEWRRV